MTLLESLINLGQPTVKVLVSCREDDQILTCFDAFSRIQVSESMLATDIEAFITGSVKSRIRSRRLKLKDPTLERNIVSDLIAKAQGMSVLQNLIICGFHSRSFILNLESYGLH
jgi:hypothetical protein